MHQDFAVVGEARWFAEAVGGQRLNHDRIPEQITWVEYAAFKARFASEFAPDSNIEWAQRLFAEPTPSYRRTIQPSK